MKQAYQNLREVVSEIKEEGVWNSQIQKIYSTPHFIVMTLRMPGVTKYLYLGRGNGYEGIWIADLNAPSWARIRDGYLEYLRARLKGARIISIECYENDRIVNIEYKRQNTNQMLSLFWKGRKLYYIDAKLENKKIVVYRPWHVKANLKIEKGELREVIENEWRTIEFGLDEQKESRVYEISDYLKRLEILAKSDKSINKKKKFLERKKIKIISDLKKCGQIEGLKAIVEEGLLEENIEFNGVKIQFKKNEDYYKRRNKVYEKIKGLKKGAEVLRERLREVDDHIEDSGVSRQEVFNIAQVKICRPVINEKKEESNKETVKNFEKYKVENIELLIGRNAMENDYIRTKCSNKTDYWFHIEGETGAHIIAKTDSLEKMTEHFWITIGSILRDVSKLDKTQVTILYTQVKNLKGVKGQRGMVRYSKEKYRVVDYSPSWREKNEY